MRLTDRLIRLILALSVFKFCHILKQQYSIEINHILLSKLENNRVDINIPEYDSLVQAVAEILNLDIVWLEQIRQQTEIKFLDLTNGIFPILRFASRTSLLEELRMKRNTFGWVVWQSRRNLRLSQQQVCQLLQQQFSIDIDRYLLSKIENDAVDIKLPEYDSVVQALAEILQSEITGLEEIRQQTQVRESDPNEPALITYANHLKHF